MRTHERSSIEYYLWFIFFLPTFWGFMPEYGKTLGQIIFSLISLCYAGIIVFSKHYHFKFPNLISGIFLFQCLWYTLTITINTCSINSEVSLKDYSELTRPILYLISFSLPISIHFNIHQLKGCITSFIWASLTVITFDIIKFFPFGHIILKLYTSLPPDSLNYLRFSGTFSYCYNYGFILIFSTFYCLYSSNHKLKNLLIFIILLFLTGSRSVLLATIFLLILYHFSSKKTFTNKLSEILIVAIVFVLLIGLLTILDIPIINNIFRNIVNLITALSGDGVDGSLSTRSGQLAFVIENFEKNPIFGNGPLKNTSLPIEMQLGYYLSAWGIVGVMILASLYSCFFYWAYSLRNDSNITVKNFSRTNLMWLISSLIIGLSTPITDQVRVFQLFYLMQGIQYVLYKTNRLKYKQSRYSVL